MSSINKHNDPFSDKKFNQLFKEYYEPLCRYCMKFVNDSGVAEDIVQELFVYLWENLSKINNIKAIDQYIFRAVKNKSITYLKKWTFNNIDFKPEHTDTESPFNELPTPEDLMENKELAQILEKATQSLPEKCRAVFTLKKHAEMSNNEVAQELGISVKTVEAQMTIALKKLKTYLIENWHFVGLILFHILLK